MSAPIAYLRGVAFWAPTLPGWDLARRAFRGEAAPAASGLRRPAAELLAPAERRRAPDSVALALEVAAHAVAASGFAARDLASVFTSAHGDLAITDSICTTLVQTPLLVSPTKFHNSVHNAASGYWTLATGCRQASTAVSSFECSFAAGLLEALVQCAADQRPLLLVGYDIAAAGALASTNDSRGLLGVALVISPEAGTVDLAAIHWSVEAGATRRLPLRSEAALPLATNAMADALPFFEALATGDAAPLALPLAAQLALRVRLQPVAARARG